MNRTQRLIGRAELARRITGRPRQGIYRDCKPPRGRLLPAVVGDQVDLNHPAAAAYCAEFGYQEPDGAAIAAEAREREREKSVPTYHVPPAGGAADLALSLGFAQPGDDEAMQDAQTWLEMSVKEIVARYGTFSRFKELANAAKSLVQMRGYEDDQARKRKEYIHRDHAERLVAHIDALQKNLLSDAVTNIVTTLEAQIKSGADRKELERTLHNTISRTIKLTKEQTERSLRDVS